MMKRTNRLIAVAAISIIAAAVVVLTGCDGPVTMLEDIEQRVAAATLPGAPTGLAATASGYYQIDLSWSHYGDRETGFEIERDSGSGFQAIATPDQDILAYSDTLLTAGTTYTYRVRAVNGFGQSDWSDEAAATTNALPTEPPAKPSNLVATPQNGDEVLLTWNDTSDNEENFKLQRKEGAGGIYSTVTSSIPADSTEYTDSGLNSETQYFYQILATNVAGESDWSLEANGTTLRLATPQNLQASAVDHQIDLSWDDHNFEESYELQRKKGSGGTYATIEASLAAGTTSYQDSGLDPGSTYYYQLRAQDAGGVSLWTETNATTEYMVGDTGPAGGLIFYDDEDDAIDDLPGDRYLEAAPAWTEWDPTDNVEWGYRPWDVPGAEGKAIGTGEQNTANIVAVTYHTPPYAAQVCNDLSVDAGGTTYDDWFLPSLDEVLLMRANLFDAGLGGLSGIYWTSTEADVPDDPANNAFAVGMSPDFTAEYNKSLAEYVRAIRAF